MTETNVLEPFSRRRPLKRGQRITKDGKTYRVVRVKMVRCESCGGTGRRDWIVKMKSRVGKGGTFETTWGNIVAAGYAIVVKEGA